MLSSPDFLGYYQLCQSATLGMQALRRAPSSPPPSPPRRDLRAISARSPLALPGQVDRMSACSAFCKQRASKHQDKLEASSRDLPSPPIISRDLASISPPSRLHLAAISPSSRRHLAAISPPPPPHLEARTSRHLARSRPDVPCRSGGSGCWRPRGRGWPSCSGDSWMRTRCTRRCHLARSRRASP